MSIKIFAMTHKPFDPPKDPMYVPLHVGRANAADLGFLGDDTMDSISTLNPYFCELTGMYWIWKNHHASDYVGICHYRRYLINENGSVFTEPQLEALLKEYDIITTKLLTLTCSYYEGFGENHNRRDLDLTGEVLKEKYPEYAEAFDTLVHGPHTYFGNIFIMSKENYNEYCAWLFDILFEVRNRVDFTGYNDYEKRLFGFLSEFLQTVWIRHNKLSVLECKVGMIGEKYETKQLRKTLAAFFAKRDYKGAKNYFMECYKKRPDVLMEASDVTGELRICMQIISTCEFEDEACQKCVLDEVQDYDELISFVHRLNLAVSHFLAGQETAKDTEFLKESHALSGEAIEVALQLFCHDTDMRQKTAERMKAFLP